MLKNVARSRVCLTVAVIFAPLRWWGKGILKLVVLNSAYDEIAF